MVGFDLWKGGIYNWWIDADHNSECKDADDAVFYELPVPVISTRKAVGVSVNEQTITVPVYTLRTVENARGSFRTEHGDCVSQPFFITLTKIEASDPIAVREAITRGYARLIDPEMRSEMWVPSGSRKSAVSLLQTEQAEEEEPVAEIRLDSSSQERDNSSIMTSVSAEMEEVNTSPVVNTSVADTSPVASSGLLRSPVIQRNASFNSVSDAASIKSSKSGRLVPRGDLFKVMVADASSSEGTSSFSFGKAKDPNVVPFWRGNASSASSSWSSLESRRKAKKNIMGQIASGFKNMVSSTHSLQSEDEPSPPATPVGPPPVVRPGEGIFCEWSIKKFREFFDSSVAEGKADEVVDPAIAKEVAKRKEGRSISLDDCLDEFSKEETLGEDDLWYCPQCKKHQAATKKLEIYQAPDILVICIKRFGSSRRLSDKLDQFVSFPIEGLDLNDRVEERKIARSLELSGDEAAKYGIEPDSEPLVYDLCEYRHPTQTFFMITDHHSTIIENLSRTSAHPRRRRQPLRRHGWWPLYRFLQEQAQWKVVQL